MAAMVLGAGPAAATPGPDPAPAPAPTSPAGDCAGLAELELAEVTAISAELVTAGTSDDQTDLPAFCRVALTVEPMVDIAVWLPVETYNGRFQAVGGGGYAGTISYPAMATALRDGYATASTDTGHSTPGGSFALAAPGDLDEQLIEDFASRSLFQLTEKAQTLVGAFYGMPAEYSYWNGCSTGGRQGLMLAQQLPDGYDGILAGAPAINWDRFIPAELWPQVVMQQELGGPIAPCKLEAATRAVVAACDTLDGVADGVLDDPRRCDFQAASLVGQPTDCGEFTDVDARVVQAIWDGARTVDGTRLWYGLAPGAPLQGLAGPQPFPITVDHHRYWIEQDPNWDWQKLDYAGFEENFAASQQLFNEVIGTDDPDLSAFRHSGGKVLIWHGWNDQLIFPEGTIDYYERVVDTVGNLHRAQDFARLFMAPGVEHCSGGAGADQFDMFGELVAWVEDGAAPERISAARVEDGQQVLTRPLCLYPLVARYDGSGNPRVEASYDCKRTYGRWGTPGHG
ncbi:tannase/feruloyl esterase family alpha/beta hydrolase [Modestobacter lapidis]